MRSCVFVVANGPFDLNISRRKEKKNFFSLLRACVLISSDNILRLLIVLKEMHSKFVVSLFLLFRSVVCLKSSRTISSIDNGEKKISCFLDSKNSDQSLRSSRSFPFYCFCLILLMLDQLFVSVGKNIRTHIKTNLSF